MQTKKSYNFLSQIGGGGQGVKQFRTKPLNFALYDGIPQAYSHCFCGILNAKGCVTLDEFSFPIKNKDLLYSKPHCNNKYMK